MWYFVKTQQSFILTKKTTTKCLFFSAIFFLYQNIKSQFGWKMLILVYNGGFNLYHAEYFYVLHSSPIFCRKNRI